MLFKSPSLTSLYFTTNGCCHSCLSPIKDNLGFLKSQLFVLKYFKTVGLLLIISWTISDIVKTLKNFATLSLTFSVYPLLVVHPQFKISKIMSNVVVYFINPLVYRLYCCEIHQFSMWNLVRRFLRPLNIYSTTLKSCFYDIFKINYEFTILLNY